MSVNNNRRFSSCVKYLEDASLTILTKKDVPEKEPKKVPPKVRGKHFTNLDYLAEGEFVWLTRNDSYTFPSPLYNESRDASYFEQCFYPLNRLGEGSFGSVLKVISKNDFKLYAMKVSKEPFRNDKDRALKLNEVTYHKQYSGHPNIVTLHDAWEEDRHLYMQMELCQKSLMMSEPMPEKQCWEVLADITSALAVIHDSGAAHFDVKLENIQHGYDGLYKLSDFGLVYNFNKDCKRSPQEGDAKYLAPELLASRGKITTKVDIFSLGIAVMELAGNLVLPTNGCVWKALRENTFPFTQTAHISDELFALLVKMMSPQASQRPSARDILKISSVKAVLNKRKALIGSGDKFFTMCELHPYLAVWALFGALFYLMTKAIALKHEFTLPSTSMIVDSDVSSSSYDRETTNNSLLMNGHLRPRQSSCKGLVTSTPFTAVREHALNISSIYPSKSSDEAMVMQVDDDSILPTLSFTALEADTHIFPTPSYTALEADTHIFPTPSYTVSATDSYMDQGSPESHHVRSPLAHLSLPGSSTNTKDKNVCFSAPSILKYGVSPIRLSNELKAVVKAKKRKRQMVPRNLTDTFNEGFGD